MIEISDVKKNKHHCPVNNEVQTPVSGEYMAEKSIKAGIRTILAPIRWIIITGLVFFVASGNINNLRVWVYIGVYVFGGLIIGIILYVKSPKLLYDRRKMHEGTK